MTLAWTLTAPEGGLLYIALGVFVGATIAGVRVLRGEAPAPALIPQLAVGAISLTLLVGAIALREKGIPVYHRFEVLLLAAWALSVGVLVVTRRWGHRALPAATAPMLALLCFFALILVPRSEPDPAVQRKVGVFLHILLATFGSVALAFSAAVAGLYLWQIRTMKLNPSAAVTRRLPPLEMLDRVTFLGVVVGFPFFSLAILSGWLYIGRTQHHLFSEWIRDPTVIVTLVGFLIYLALFSVRTILGWHGRRIAWFTVVGFLIVVVGFVVASFCPSAAVMHTP